MKNEPSRKTNGLRNAMNTLPPGYSQQAVVSLSQSLGFVVAATLAGIVLLVATGWLLVQFTNSLRPEALAGIGLGDIMTPADNGFAINLPLGLIRDFVLAVILSLVIHELVHGLFFWLFSGRRPGFGVRGLLLYAAAPEGVYFPRNQYLIVGIAPLLCLTLLGLLLIPIAPAALVPILLFFVWFNVAGSAGDVLVVIWLLSFSADTVMEDSGTTTIVYGPGE